METKICRIDNSLGIVIPDDMLAHLQVKEGDSVVFLRGEDDCVKIVSAKTNLGKTMIIAQDIMRRYSKTLRALSD